MSAITERFASFKGPKDKAYRNGFCAFSGGVLAFVPAKPRASLAALFSTRTNNKTNKKEFYDLANVKRISSFKEATYNDFQLGDDAVDWGIVLQKGSEIIEISINKKNHHLKFRTAISANIWSSMMAFRASSLSFSESKRMKTPKSPAVKKVKKVPDILACLIVNLVRNIREKKDYDKQGIFRVNGNDVRVEDLIGSLLYQAGTPDFQISERAKVAWYKDINSETAVQESPTIPRGRKIQPSEIRENWIKYEKLWTRIDMKFVRPVPVSYLEKRIEIDNKYTCHDCASAIKRILRMLPDTAFCSYFYDKFLEASSPNDIAVAVEKLPDSNKIVLKELFGLLDLVNQHSSASKMTVDNLCRVFAPAFVRTRETPDDYRPQKEEEKYGKEIEESAQTMKSTFDILISFYEEVFIQKIFENRKRTESHPANHITIRSPTMSVSSRRGTSMYNPISTERKSIASPALGNTLLGRSMARGFRPLDTTRSDSPAGRDSKHLTKSFNFSPQALNFKPTEYAIPELEGDGKLNGRNSPTYLENRPGTRIGFNVGPTNILGRQEFAHTMESIRHEEEEENGPPEGKEARDQLLKDVAELIEDLTVLQGKTLLRKALKVKGVRELKARLGRLKILLQTFLVYEKSHSYYAFKNVTEWVEEHAEKFDMEHDMWEKLKKAGFSFFQSLNYRFKNLVQRAIRDAMESMSTFTAAFSLDKNAALLRLRGAGTLDKAVDIFKQGQDYFFGHSVQQDWQKARECYKKAATIGRHKEALFCLANMLRLGQGGIESLSTAKWYYQAAADMGHRDAQYWLGRIFEEEYVEYGRSDAATLAKEYYHFAATFDEDDPKDTPCPAAMVALGYMWECGNRYGLETSVEEASNWYQNAARLDYPNGMNHIGLLLFNGKVDHEGKLISSDSQSTKESVRLRHKSALQWFVKGAQYHHAGCHLNIGRMYEGGYAVPRNEEKALYHYECAMNHGHVDAEASLGYLFLKQNLYSKAVHHLSHAADNGSAEAYYHLGEIYEHGLGICKNLSVAHSHYKKSCEMGLPKAILKRAHFLFSGHSFPGQSVHKRTQNQRYKEALGLYKRAVKEHNSAEAENCLGVMFEEGFGVKSDYKQAIEYYRNSAQKNNSAAMVNLAMMLEIGKGLESPDKVQAFELLEKASRNGNLQAKVLLARKDVIDEYEPHGSLMFT